MATIIKRGPYQYQVQVRCTGYPSQTRTFETKRDATAWAATVESEMRRGLFVDRSEAERTTLGEILERYRQEVTPEKRGWRAENSRLKQLIRHPLSKRILATLRGVDFANYRDERLQGNPDAGISAVGPKTVVLELLMFSAVLNTARVDWSIPVENPIPHIRKPQVRNARELRLVDDEEARLLQAANQSRAPGLVLGILLAIETGMRRGEIAGLEWDQFDLHNSVIYLDITKNGDSRVVPLSATAEEAIRSFPRPPQGGKVLTFFDSNGLGAAFVRACERAGIEGLCFHDLRHEAASRLAKRMPAVTLAKVMGWRTLQMAMRYYNPTAAELVSAVRAS